MIIKRQIEILEDAIKVFKQVPTIKLLNEGGLCYYLKHVHDLSEIDIEEILGSQYYSRYRYTIAPFSQRKLWYAGDSKLKALRFDRVKWCKKRIKELQGELK